MAAPLGLNYGGRLTTDNGAPVTGPVELQVGFFGSATGGAALRTPVDHKGVALSNGVFQVDLELTSGDLGALFGGGGPVFVEIKDVTHGKTYPRQRLSAVPYALRVPVDGASVVYDNDGNLSVGAVDAAKVTGLSAMLADMGDAAKLQGVPLSTGTPAAGAVLKYVGGQWQAAAGDSVSGNFGIGTTSAQTALDVAGVLTQRGNAAPAVAPAGEGRIYFDATSNQFMVSQNGGAYAPLGTVTGGVITQVSAGSGLTGGGTTGNVTVGMPNVGTAGTYTRVVTDAYGRVTAGGTLTAADLPSVPVGLISGSLPVTQLAGTLATSQLPSVPVTQLSGTLTTSQLPSLPVTQLSGTLTTAQLPSLSAAQITSGTFAAAQVPALDASKITSGLLAVADGGTGANSFTNNGVLVGGGAGPLSATAAGSQYQVLTANGAGQPVFGAVNLDQGPAVAGTLPVANGGTGSGTALTGNRLIMSSGSALVEAPTVSVTSGKIGIGTTSASSLLDVDGSGLGSGLRLRYPGMTMPSYSSWWPGMPVDTVAALLYGSSGYGGLDIFGFTKSGSTNGYPARLNGIHGSTSPLTPAVSLVGRKADGAGGITSLASNEIAADIENAGTPLLTVMGGGSVGIGTSSPGTLLDVAGALTQRAITPPAVAPTAQGRLYFDSASNQFLVSQNGGAYAPLSTLTALGSAGSYTKVVTDPYGRVTAGTSLAVSDLPPLSLGQLTGTLAASQVAPIPTSQITGTLAGAQVGPLSAGQVTSGTLALAQLPSIPSTQLTGTLASAQIGAAGSDGQVQFNAGGALSADTSLFWNNATKRLGIGTSSPGSALESTGAITVTSGYGASNSNGSYVTLGGQGTSPYMGSLNFGDNSGWRFTLGTRVTGVYTPRVTFVDTGSVGIGTTTPANLLHLYTTSTSATLKLENGGSGGDSAIKMKTLNSATWQAYVQDSSQSFRLHNGTSDALAVLPTSGNVGIGTTTPGTKLSVNGTLGIGADELPLQETYFGYGGSYRVLRLGLNQTSRSLALNVDPMTVAGGNFSGAGEILIGNAGILAPNAAGTDWMGVLRATGGKVYLGGSNAAGDLIGDGLVVSGSNVGIGSLTPGNKLDVAGGIDTAYGSGLRLMNGSTQLSHFFYSGGTVIDRSTGTGFALAENGSVQFRVAAGGNVGVGTTSPTSLLSVGLANQFQVSSAGDLSVIKNVPYSWPASQGGANTYLMNDSSGNLSWNTPSYMVVGGTMTGATSGSVLFANGGTLAQNNASFYWDNTNSRLGIGTTSPTQQIHAYVTTGNSGILAQTGTGGAGFNMIAGTNSWSLFTASGSDSLQVWSTTLNKDALIVSNTAGISLGAYTPNAAPTGGMIIPGSVGIGTSSPNSPLQVNGAFATTVASKTAAYTLTATDSVITVNASGGALTMTLPTAVGIAGREYTIVKSDTSANIVTVATTSSQTINGNANYSLWAPYKHVKVVSDGANWIVTSSDEAPIGAIVAFSKSTAPTGYLACDGASYSTTTYAALFAVIGYTFGGSGASFNVPDLRGRTAIGQGTGAGLSARTIAGKGGEENHTLTVAEMPSHNHGPGGPTYFWGWDASGTGLTSPQALGSGPGTTSGIFSYTSNTGGGGSHNTMMPYEVVNYMIKY